MITVGNPFPQFELKATVSNDVHDAFRVINNDTYKEKWLVVFSGLKILPLYAQLKSLNLASSRLNLPIEMLKF